MKHFTAEDFRFTQNGKHVYAIAMAWPRDGRAVIHALGAAHESKGLRIANVELLGSDSKIDWRQSEDALEIRVPPSAPGKYAYVFRVTTAQQ
jgi:alpha-L-fucosidase